MAGIIITAASHLTYAQLQQGSDMKTATVEYQMPYPGLLPDSPIYGFKKLRDFVWLMGTGDYGKKAEVLLLLSDKQMKGAELMMDKGKAGASVEMARRSEELFRQILENNKKGQQQGRKPQSEFIQQLKLSNQKHAEIITDLLTEAPQGKRAELEEVLEMNESIAGKI